MKRRDLVALKNVLTQLQQFADSTLDAAARAKLSSDVQAALAQFGLDFSDWCRFLSLLLLAILRESTPQDAVAPETLDEAPVRSLELLLSRWSVVRE